MKILFIVNNSSYFIGHRLALAKFCQSKGYHISLIAKLDQKEHLQLFAGTNIDFHQVAMSRRGINPFAEIKTFLQLAILSKKIQPDLIHALTIKAVIYSGIFARLKKIPFIALIPGLGTAFNSSGFVGMILRLVASNLYKLALFQHAHVVFENESNLNFFVSSGLVTKNQVFLSSGSGVDCTKFFLKPLIKSPASSTISVVLAARMLRDKGVYEFAEAAKILSLEHPKAQFMLVGGPDIDNPTSLTKDELENLEKIYPVKWLGASSNMVETLQSCDIFCLPSYHEGLAVSLLEAGSCGIALVASNIPGCSEIVIHEKTGLLAQVRDAKDLAAKIKQFLVSEALRKELGQNARLHVETNFSNQVVFAFYLRLYKQVNYARFEHPNYETSHQI